MYAPDGSCRSSARMIHAIWCTMFSVTFPPENSQYSRQLMNLNGSNGRFERPLRNESHFTLALVQSGGTGRTHCGFPRGVLRLIHDSTWGILPTRPCLIHSFESDNDPALCCWRPMVLTRSERFAASRHPSASSIDHVIVFSE